jgi:hypothetical protein
VIAVAAALQLPLDLQPPLRVAGHEQQGASQAAFARPPERFQQRLQFPGPSRGAQQDEARGQTKLTPQADPFGIR